jgi:hypothetical protein
MSKIQGWAFMDPEVHLDDEPEDGNSLVQYISEKTFFHLGINITDFTIVDKFLYVSRTSLDN